MEEQVEIKVRRDCCVWRNVLQAPPCVFSFMWFCRVVFAEAADREQAPEAEDRHVRKSECISVCRRCSATRQTNKTLFPAHQHYINPPSCERSYIMHLLLMMESRLSLTALWKSSIYMINHRWLAGSVVNVLIVDKANIRNRNQICTSCHHGVMATDRVARKARWSEFQNSPDATNWSWDWNEPVWNVKVAAWWRSSRCKALHAKLHCLYHPAHFRVSSNGHYCCQVKAPCMRSALNCKGVRCTAFACREEHWSNRVCHLKPAGGCCSLTWLCPVTPRTF